MKYNQFINEKINPSNDAIKTTSADVKPETKKQKPSHQRLIPNIPTEINKIMQGIGDNVAPNIGKKSAAKDFDQYAKNAQAKRDEPYQDSIAAFDDPKEEKKKLHQIQRSEPSSDDIENMSSISRVLDRQRKDRMKTNNQVSGKPAGAQVAAITENSALKSIYDALTTGRVREADDEEIMNKYFQKPTDDSVKRSRIYNQTGQGLAKNIRDRLGLADDEMTDEYYYENITGNDDDIPEESRTNAYKYIQNKVTESLKNTPAGVVPQELLDSSAMDYLSDSDREMMSRVIDVDDENYDGDDFQSYLTDAQRRNWSKLTPDKKEAAIKKGIEKRLNTSSKLKSNQDKKIKIAETKRQKEIDSAKGSIDKFRKLYDSDQKDSMDPTDIALVKKADQERLISAIDNIWDDPNIPIETKVGMSAHYLSQSIENNSILPISLKALGGKESADNSSLDEVQLDPEDYLKASSMMFGDKNNPISMGMQLKGLDGDIDFDSSSLRFPFSLQYDGQDMPGKYNYFVQQHQGGGDTNKGKYYDYRKGGQKFEPSLDGAGAKLGQIPTDLGRQQIDYYNPLPEEIDFQDIYGFDGTYNKREISPEVKNYWVNEIADAFNYKKNDQGIDFPMNPDMLTIGDKTYEDPKEYAESLFEIEKAISDKGSIEDTGVIDKHFPGLSKDNPKYSGLYGVPKYIRGALQRVRTIRAMQNANDQGELKDMIGYGIARAGKKRGGPEDPYIFPHLKSHGKSEEDD